MHILGTRRGVVRAISFGVAIALVIVGAGVSGFALVSRYKTTIEYTYQRSLSQLSDYFSTLQTTLTKGIYANTSSQQYGLASKLMVESEGAKNALSQLPLSDGEGEALQKYLAQVGDFSSYMIGILSRNESLTKDNMSAMEELAKYADRVSPQIEELSARYGDGGENISKALDVRGNLDRGEQQTVDEMSFENTFSGMNESFTDYPTLLYDGPFADQIQQKTPRLTKDSDGYSVENAKERVCEFLNISVNEIEYTQARKGNIPAYVFQGESLFATVTIKGGYIGEMYNNKSQAGNHTMGFSEASQKARDFLKQRKIYNMTESYYVIADDVCTINYAYKDEKTNTICYSDLIKVGISTKTGQVVSFNAEGYIMNHYDREFPEPALTQTKAQQSLSSRLTVNTAGVAMIPTGGSREVLCYEFTCTGENNDRVIVYVNCDTGLEEQIFILLQSDGGTLVM
ncbi:MAG TPA: hypothetical protein GX401_07710 [Clostridiales bacterium]|nr:hypothetical protein [Clostridiales bacterium]